MILQTEGSDLFPGDCEINQDEIEDYSDVNLMPKSPVARGLFMLAAALLFMAAVYKTPAIDLQQSDGNLFLLLIAGAFAIATVVSASLKLEYSLLLLIAAVFTLPLTRVTESGSYNVVSAGLFFGALIHLRYTGIRLPFGLKYLFVSLVAIGVYFNIVPVLFDDGDGFNNKLWLYNFTTFVKYLLVGLLVTQSRLDLWRLAKWVNVAAIIYAATVIVDAYHVPALNIAMKSFSGLGQQTSDFTRNVALNYFRSSGVGYDPNHTGAGLALLLVVALATWSRERLVLATIPLLIVAVLLTGSRAASILSLVALASWFVFQREWISQLSGLFKWTVIAGAITLVALSNTSFEHTMKTGISRNIAFVTTEGLTTDESLRFRVRKVTDTGITAFGDRTERLSEVHSEVVRAIRFYGLFGVVASLAFWIGWLLISRGSYLGFTLVFLLSLTSLYRWTWHVEAAFIPVLLIAVLAIKKLHPDTSTSKVKP